MCCTRCSAFRAISVAFSCRLYALRVTTTRGCNALLSHPVDGRYGPHPTGDDSGIWVGIWVETRKRPVRCRPHGAFPVQKWEPTKGFEPPTHALRKHCSTPELRRR